jgi:uncharacterized protein (DUF58 family)
VRAWQTWTDKVARLARPRAPESLPRSLDRRRIYVLPTPFGSFMALLLLAMLLGALNYNNNPALLLALLLATAGIASAIMAHLQLSGLRIDTLAAEPVAAGTPLRLRVALSSHDHRARRGLRLDLEGQQVFCTLPPLGSATAELTLTTSARGWREIGRLRISTTQPMGLVRAWSWIWPEAPLLVYPHPEQDAPPLPSGEGAVLRTRPDSQGEEMHQLRPYRTGDSVRTISWKHSARRDTLLVREFETPAGVEVTLDWRRLAALPYERRIARLARWVDDAERQGRRYRLHLPYPPPLGPGQGAQHRHHCLRALALLPHD